jgi:CBS domain containing-hemolysin-like protein
MLIGVIMIFFGEIIPKYLAGKDPLFTLRIILIPIYWLSVLFYPVSELMNEISSLFSRIFIKLNNAASKNQADENDVNKIKLNGKFIEAEQGLIDSIAGFHSITVREVMTPRVDITAIPYDADFNELLSTITSSGHSRIPLYKENLDDIVGIIYAKDLLPYIKNETKSKQILLSKIARKAFFVPQAKMINDLLNDFQEKKMHIAVVVDEFGGTAGLISLEDIIEEITGEIRDEYDKEENPVTKIDENNYVVLGKLSIYELNELINTNIDSQNPDFETVAGLILNTIGQIPKEGYSFRLENHKFTVKEILNKRIKRVQVEKLQGE